MMKPRLDALIAQRFAYNPMGRRHAALVGQRITPAETRSAVRTAVELARDTRVSTSGGASTVRTATRLRPRTGLRAAGLAFGVCVRQVTPTLRPAFSGIDAVFGHANGTSGCHIHGLLPQLGWVPSALGAALGGAVGWMGGLLTLPVFADDARPTAWLRRGALAGAVVGACIGGVPRWALCQASAMAGLSIKYGLVGLAVVAMLVVKIASHLMARRPDVMDKLVADGTMQADLKLHADATVGVNTVIATVPLIKGVAEAVAPQCTQLAQHAAEAVKAVVPQVTKQAQHAVEAVEAVVPRVAEQAQHAVKAVVPQVAEQAQHAVEAVVPWVTKQAQHAVEAVVSQVTKQAQRVAEAAPVIAAQAQQRVAQNWHGYASAACLAALYVGLSGVRGLTVG